MIFVEQLRNFLKPDDVVIGISGSGNSANVIRAVEYANENGAISAAFTGFDGGYLAKISKIPIIVPINDMQKVEDIHLILTHIIMQILQKNLIQQGTVKGSSSQILEIRPKPVMENMQKT